MNKGSSPSFWGILLFVVGCHAFMLWVLPALKSSTPKIEKKPKVIVKTIELTPSPPQKALQPLAAAQEITPTVIVEQPIPPTPKPEPTPPMPAPPEPAPPAPAPPPPPTPAPAEEKPTPKPAPQPTPPPVKKPPPAPVKKPAPKPSKPTTPAPVVKAAPAKPPEKTAKEKAEEEAKKQQALEAERVRKEKMEKMAAIKGNLAKLDATPTATTQSSSSLATMELPNSVTQLHTDTALSSVPQTASYEERVKFQLQNTLILPEHGKVTVHLTLQKAGKLVKFEIVSSESQKNRSYVQQKLPTVIFPKWTDEAGDTQELTIQLTNR